MPAVAKIPSYILATGESSLYIYTYTRRRENPYGRVPSYFRFYRISDFIPFPANPVPRDAGKGFSAEFYANYAAKLLGNFQKSFES